MKMLDGRVVVFGALPESLINFRGHLLNALSEVARVHAIAGESEAVRGKLSSFGVGYSAAPIKRAGLNPITDFALLLWLIREWHRLCPSKILAYTIKPVIWGGIAARFFPKIEFYALITGLGYVFEGDTLERRVLRGIVKILYKLALIKAKAVIFQNRDNMELFIELGICSAEQAHVVNGSGVDIDQFSFSPIDTSSTFTFLMIARILKAKGVIEFIRSAEQVKQSYPQASFVFVGPEDPSPDGLKQKIFKRTRAVRYLGRQDDVRPWIQQCSVYVLPSYHEGLPRSTIEAMAMGRPIITTDAVGCRDTVLDRVNGFKVAIGDPEALAEKMVWCIENKEKLVNMGLKSRELAEERFDVRKVNADILEVMGLRS